MKSAGDLAVTMALSENQIIVENKEFFKQYGIDMNAIESTNSQFKASKRSTTTLLIKNLKYNETDPEELENMFTK